MVFASGYQKNFGSQSDDPKMAMSWEDQYQKLMASANAEELRKKWAGPGWTSLGRCRAAGAVIHAILRIHCRPGSI